MDDALDFIKKYRYTMGVVSVLILLLVVSGTFFALGYRLGPGLSILRAGTLVVSDLKPGSSIYIDDGFNGQTKSAEMRILLTPGSHRIIVSISEDQPWSKIFSIDAGQDTTVRPVYVAKVNVVKPLAKELQAQAKSIIRAYSLPTPAKPLLMEGGCAQVYTDLGRVVAVGTTTPTCKAPPFLCQDNVCNPTIIFSPTETLASVIPFPGRDDVLVISAGDRVFVLEVDPRTPQFFSPVIHTGNAVAIPWSATSIVVSSDEGIREVPL